MEAFAILVQRGRVATGLSYQRIGELVGRSPATIRDWERGRSSPNDPEVVSALAAVLDLPEDDLLESLGLSRPPAAPVASFSDLAPSAEGAEAVGEDVDIGDEEPVAGMVLEPEAEAGVLAGPEVGPEALPERGGEMAKSSDGDVPLSAEPAGETVPTEQVGEPSARLEPEAEGSTEPEDAEVAEAGQSQEVEEPGGAGAPRQPEPSIEHIEPPTHRTTIPPQPPPPRVAPVGSEPSYLEDGRQMATYRVRTVITVVVGIVLLLVLEWALHGLGVSLKDAFSGLHP
jgi:transcriptional regulator with XRE-family HTH domain